MRKKVFVSGCFDLLHSGHVEFLQQAAAFGDLYVALGSDRTVTALKGRAPLNTESERQFMVQALRCVQEAFISAGSGTLDFVDELESVRPDVFVVNEDGHAPEKERLCASRGITYTVLERVPHTGLPVRSTTALRERGRMPYRIDLAGGWLDQPYVSKLHPGSVLTISLEPTRPFNARSGMATSTRESALELWGPALPPGDPERLATLLFRYDNPPGTDPISGSQDAIGLVFPGLARASYEGRYWPERIDSVRDEAVLQFIEKALYLVPLHPRAAGYDPLADTDITPDRARALAEAADACWDAALNRDLEGFGRAMTAGFEAQVAMFPGMVNDAVREHVDAHRHRAAGWKVSGAGGGGYLILVSDEPVPDALQVSIRRV